MAATFTGKCTAAEPPHSVSRPSTAAATVFARRTVGAVALLSILFSINLGSLWGQAAPEPPGFPLTVSGLLDTYAGYDFNHPASGYTLYRNFDVRANRAAISMARLAIQHEGTLGFRVDLGLGKAWEVVNFQDTANGFRAMKYIPQAYVSLKPKQWKGAQVDFGKFYTSAGAELTEAHLDWNYSRSLIYANGPYYHFGLRASVPIRENFTVGAQLVNGWNNVEDNNSGKTLGLTTSLTAGKVTWANNYYVGPEKTNTNRGFRHFYDTVISTSGPIVSTYVNVNYGLDRPAVGGRGNEWVAIAGAAKFQLTPKISVSPRAELYDDRDGFITGRAQRIKELTITGEYKIHPHVVSRLEYRRDWSDAAVFERRATQDPVKNQSTVVVG